MLLPLAGASAPRPVFRSPPAADLTDNRQSGRYAGGKLITISENRHGGAGPRALSNQGSSPGISLAHHARVVDALGKRYTSSLGSARSLHSSLVSHVTVRGASTALPAPRNWLKIFASVAIFLLFYFPNSPVPTEACRPRGRPYNISTARSFALRDGAFSRTSCSLGRTTCFGQDSSPALPCQLLKTMLDLPIFQGHECDNHDSPHLHAPTLARVCSKLSSSSSSSLTTSLKAMKVRVAGWIGPVAPRPIRSRPLNEPCPELAARVRLLWLFVATSFPRRTRKSNWPTCVRRPCSQSLPRFGPAASIRMSTSPDAMNEKPAPAT